MRKGQERKRAVEIRWTNPAYLTVGEAEAYREGDHYVIFPKTVYRLWRALDPSVKGTETSARGWAHASPVAFRIYHRDHVRRMKAIPGGRWDTCIHPDGKVYVKVWIDEETR